MKTRAFGQVLTFLYAGALIARDYSGQNVGPLRERLAQMTQMFCAARPTFDFRGLGRYFEHFLDNLQDGDDCGAVLSARLSASPVRSTTRATHAPNAPQKSCLIRPGFSPTATLAASWLPWQRTAKNWVKNFP